MSRLRSVALLAAGLVAGSALTGVVLASSYDVAANCTVAALHFVVDGQANQPQVANGNPAGFICDGTTYVPVRWVAQSLGQSVGWDGSTDTVTLSPGSSGSASSGSSGAGSTASKPTPAAPTVKEATVPSLTSLGPILVTGGGMTLYTFAQDSPGVSTCTGSCAAAWPPLTVTGTPSGGPGVTGTVGTLTRSDGSKQVTYNGWPLYLYAGDTQPGQANGQGVYGVWSVVTSDTGTHGSAGGSTGGGY